MMKQILRIKLLTNFSRDLADAMRDRREMTKKLGVIDPDPQNFVPNCIDEIEFEYEEFKGFEKELLNLRRT